MLEYQSAIQAPLKIQWKWKHKYSDTTVSIKDEAMDGKFTYAKMLDNDIIGSSEKRPFLGKQQRDWKYLIDESKK